MIASDMVGASVSVENSAMSMVASLPPRATVRSWKVEGVRVAYQ